MKKESKGKEVLNEFQVSMTEWLASINKRSEADAFRKEDNTKDDRLEILYQVLGLQYERPTNFPAVDLITKSKEFLSFFHKHKDELCALRLMATKPELPKLRNRGLSVKDVYENWFPKQVIDHKDYIASFRPHAGTYPLSLIVVISPQGIFGEAVVGQHAQLTQGNTESEPTRFSYNFKTWQWHNKTKLASSVVQKILRKLKVAPAKQKTLAKKLKSKFKNGYHLGYYEAILWTDGIIRFSDFNRLLHSKLARPTLTPPSGLHGVGVYKGVVKGKVCVVAEEEIAKKKFPKNAILVTDNTDVRFLPLMKKASAIITNRGGMLSHAAIVARELKTPCIVGVKDASRILCDGDLIEIDGAKGNVKILEK